MSNTLSEQSRLDHDGSMHPVTRRPADSEEIKLRELLGILWNGRAFILWVTVGCIVASAVGAFIVTPTYEASIVISPVSTSSSGGALGGLGSLGSSLGGLAALAGVSVGADSKKSESIAVLQSESLTEAYIERNHLLPVLYFDKWDSRLGRWKTGNPQDVPTLWKANQFFKRTIRTVSSDTKTGLVTVTIDWRDPAVAADWANGIVQMANLYMRDKAIAEAERNIAYLYDEAAKTSVVEVRQGIYTVVETEIKQEMLARGTNEFAFKVLDVAKPPEKPASPQKRVWVIMGAVGGLLLSVLVVLARFAWRQAPRS